MTLILDASILPQWYFSEPFDTELDVLLTRLEEEPAFVPSTWWIETRDILIGAEGAHQIDASDTSGILADLGGLPLEIAEPSHSDILLALARKHAISASEAAYIELALRQGAALATRSPSLRRAAQEEGLALIP
jgi:predicted nucleic acid-binding protein